MSRYLLSKNIPSVSSAFAGLSYPPVLSLIISMNSFLLMLSLFKGRTKIMLHHIPSKLFHLIFVSSAIFLQMTSDFPNPILKPYNERAF
jgi:hypothetical protein